MLSRCFVVAGETLLSPYLVYRVQFSYIKSLSLSFRCLGYLDGQTKEVKPHRESSCYEKFIHNLRSTQKKCQNLPKYQSGILEDFLNNLSSKSDDIV